MGQVIVKPGPRYSEVHQGVLQAVGQMLLDRDARIEIIHETVPGGKRVVSSTIKITVPVRGVM